jgi:hypothetical protein
MSASASFFNPIFLVDLILASDPLWISAETAFVPLEHLRGFLVSLQLPIQPGKRDFAESAAIGIVIGAAVTDSFLVGAKYRHVVNFFKVVICIRASNVRFVAAHVKRRRVHQIQRLLGNRLAAACHRRRLSH